MIKEDIKKLFRNNFNQIFYLSVLLIFLLEKFDSVYGDKYPFGLYLLGIIVLSFISIRMVDKYTFKRVEGDGIFEWKFIFQIFIVYLLISVLLLILTVLYPTENVLNLYFGFLLRFYFGFSRVILVVLSFKYLKKIFDKFPKRKKDGEDDENPLKNNIMVFFIDFDYFFSTLFISTTLIYFLVGFDNYKIDLNSILIILAFVIFALVISFIIDIISYKLDLYNRLNIFMKSVLGLVISYLLKYGVKYIMTLPVISGNNDVIKFLNVIDRYYFYVVFSAVIIIFSICFDKTNKFLDRNKNKNKTKSEE